MAVLVRRLVARQHGGGDGLLGAVGVDVGDALGRLRPRRRGGEHGEGEREGGPRD